MGTAWAHRGPGLSPPGQGQRDTHGPWASVVPLTAAERDGFLQHSNHRRGPAGQSRPAPQGGPHAPAAPPGVKGRIVRPRLEVGGCPPRGARLCPPCGRVEAPTSRAGVAPRRPGVDVGRRALQGPALCRATARFLRPQSRGAGPHGPATSPAKARAAVTTLPCPLSRRWHFLWRDLRVPSRWQASPRSARGVHCPPPPRAGQLRKRPAMQGGRPGAVGGTRRDPSQDAWVAPSPRPIPVFRCLAGRELRA